MSAASSNMVIGHNTNQREIDMTTTQALAFPETNPVGWEYARNID